MAVCINIIRIRHHDPNVSSSYSSSSPSSSCHPTINITDMVIVTVCAIFADVISTIVAVMSRGKG